MKKIRKTLDLDAKLVKETVKKAKKQKRSFTKHVELLMEQDNEKVQ